MTKGAVLVGIDFSEPGARALDEARSIARSLGAETEVVHVTGRPRGWQAGEEESAWMEREGLEPASLRVRHGTPWVELARHADEHDPLLIVVGTHGQGGYHPVSLGTTAFRLTLAATRPVLVVGQRTVIGAAGPAAGVDRTLESGSPALP